MRTVDVSVLITNYNHAHYLPEYLEAIYTQSVLPKEVIVIDDSSTDDSMIKIGNLKKRYPSLIVLENILNLGPAKAMNVAISSASGKYAVLAAADDKALPGFLEKGSKYLDLHTDIGICCSNPTFFSDVNPKQSWKLFVSQKKEVTLFPAPNIHRDFLFSTLWIPTHACLYRTELLLKYGCLDDGLKNLCDWYLNSKIALNHGMVFVPESFAAFRVSNTSYGAIWNGSFRKKIPLYKHLFSRLSQESPIFQKKFQQSAFLGLISSDVFIYLLRHPCLWKYIHYALYRKTCNLFRKMKRIASSLHKK